MKRQYTVHYPTLEAMVKACIEQNISLDFPKRGIYVTTVTDPDLAEHARHTTSITTWTMGIIRKRERRINHVFTYPPQVYKFCGAPPNHVHSETDKAVKDLQRAIAEYHNATPTKNSQKEGDTP